MQSIHQDVRNMSKLTQTLLEFAKASGNAGGLQISLVRIDEIILSLPAEIARLHENYSVNIQFKELPENDEELLVFGNETLLATAIKNIAANACKYSTDHHADVQLHVNKNAVFITVEDKGIGIPADKLATIFQPFYRLDENSAAEGFGLGLSLADRIIKLHKGSISVQSQNDVGTKFVIQLPAASNFHHL